jgi:hypothetical protein
MLESTETVRVFWVRLMAKIKPENRGRGVQNY